MCFVDFCVSFHGFVFSSFRMHPFDSVFFGLSMICFVSLPHIATFLIASVNPSVFCDFAFVSLNHNYLRSIHPFHNIFFLLCTFSDVILMTSLWSLASLLYFCFGSVFFFTKLLPACTIVWTCNWVSNRLYVSWISLREHIYNVSPLNIVYHVQFLVPQNTVCFMV